MSTIASDDVLLVSSRDIAGSLVEVWTLNREKNLNALNSAILKRVEQEAKNLSQKLTNNKTRALVLTGAGDKAFVAGADIVEMKDFGGEAAAEFSRLGHRAFAALEKLPIPTIAAVNGFALGGGLELAMSCDFIFASKKSKFGQPEATLGLIPGFGATARFVEKLGRAKALEYFYSNEMLTADEALKYGLIERICSDDTTPMDAALAYLEIVIKKSGPRAIAEVKRITQLIYREQVDAICREEATAFGKIFESADKKEGVAAFLEKRPAKFEGK